MDNSFIVYEEIEFDDEPPLCWSRPPASVGVMEMREGCIFVPSCDNPSAFRVVFIGPETEARARYGKMLAGACIIGPD